MDINDFLKLAKSGATNVASMEMFQGVDGIPAEERMQYPIFLREFTTFRASQIPNHLTDMTDLQLPNMSALHTLGHFLDPANNGSIAPDTTLTLRQNEEFIQYLTFVTALPNKDSAPFASTEKFSSYSEARYLNQARAFFEQNKTYRRVMSLPGIVERPNVLLNMEYNALLRPVLTGRLVLYRKFEMVLKAMLNNVAQIPSRHHYLLFPVSRNVYSRAVYMRAIKKADTSTIRVLDDPTFYLMVHILGLVRDGAELTKETVNEKNLSVSLFSRLSADVRARTNIILTHNNQAIIYNLGELTNWASATSTLDTRVLRHVAKLQLIDDPLIASGGLDQIADTNFEETIADKIRSEDDPKAQVTPVVSTPERDEPPVVQAPVAGPQEVPQDVPSEVEKTEAPERKNPFAAPPRSASPKVKELKEKVNQHLALDPTITDDHKAKVDFLLDRHMAVTIGGRTIGELTSDKPLPDIHANDLTFLKDRMVDESMTKSTIASFDRSYVTEMMDRDIASVLSSFISKGYFITNVSEKDDITQLDRIRHYHVDMVDVTGKRHNLSFKMPIVDRDGVVLSNGVRSKMVKQQVNVPICKLDTYRVNLSSNYNKQLVERSRLRANNFETWINNYVSSIRKAGRLTTVPGEYISKSPLPYEYQVLAKTYNAITVEDAVFYFGFDSRALVASQVGLVASTEVVTDQPGGSTDAELIIKGLESKYGVFFGYDTTTNAQFYMGMSNRVTVIGADRKVMKTTNVAALIASYAGDAHTPPPMLSEWTEAKIQDKSFPLAFILGYQFGFKNVLHDMKAKWRFVHKEDRATKRYPDQDEIVVEFADGRLYFSRYPFEQSMIMSGLNRFNMRGYTFDSLDVQDTYFTILADNGWSTNYLKSIRSFFDLFLDPITVDVLKHMGEPTTVRGLLMRATQMLATIDVIESSSMKNHRLRGYERFPSALYNVVSREIAAMDARRGGKKKSLSINPNAVFMKIVGDATFNLLDEINPVHDIKQTNAFTYSGSGGRTAQSFVVKDRRYPKDGLGAMSESTPDSGKVAINAFTPVDPVIKNIRGMYDLDAITPETIKPAQLLSSAALLLPGSTQDDEHSTWS